MYEQSLFCYYVIHRPVGHSHFALDYTRIGSTRLCEFSSGWLLFSLFIVIILPSHELSTHNANMLRYFFLSSRCKKATTYTLIHFYFHYFSQIPLKIILNMFFFTEHCINLSQLKYNMIDNLIYISNVKIVTISKFNNN